MAQTYKIYLKKRLTEFDLIIKNLPYRDGIIIYNKLYLDAMVNYLNIEKSIIGYTDIELTTQIDNILEQIFNIFNNGLEINADVSFICQKSVLFNSEAKLDGSLKLINEECFNAFNTLTNLTALISNYEVAKSLGAGHNSMELSTRFINTLKKCFNKMNNQLSLNTELLTNATKFTSISTDMDFKTSNFDIFYFIAVQCEAVCSLFCNADIELWYTLGNAKNNMILNVYNNSVKSEKFISYNDLLSLVAEINTILYCIICPSSQSSILNSKIDVEIKRCRLLNEVDNSTLVDMDTESLNDLDYVIIV